MQHTGKHNSKRISWSSIKPNLFEMILYCVPGNWVSIRYNFLFYYKEAQFKNLSKWMLVRAYFTRSNSSTFSTYHISPYKYSITHIAINIWKFFTLLTVTKSLKFLNIAKIFRYLFKTRFPWPVLGLRKGPQKLYVLYNSETCMLVVVKKNNFYMHLSHL